jgi:hypothetical protein
MASTLAGTILRPDSSPYRGASFRIRAIAQGGAMVSSKTVVAGDAGTYSMSLNPSVGMVYEFVPLSTGLPPAFFFSPPADGSTTHVLDLAPVGEPVTVDAAAVLTAALNAHVNDATPHPNYDQAFVHIQSTPSASWYITNPFSRKVDVAVFVDDERVETDVEVTDVYVHVTFASAQSGQLVIS